VSGDLYIEVSECVELTPDVERHACYDRLAEAAKAAQAAKTDLLSNFAETAPGQPEPARTNPQPEEIVSTITELKETRPNVYTITLENGQIWRQVGSKRYPLRIGFEVRIYESRWQSSYRLSAVATNGFIQVERIR
jgi:hypothetical protein